ncbi:hypothetical protein QBC38DRAFT_525148 [Podospora fimiseda]|uniref:Uncharacterized protein n=1 Tax=Podospora fimiseda TaxID=252190 RepID=A0AAN6YQ21_9PEZI|nr:hypothetical protein QBC38DRAFT_525148 [Podospora fimiseda]
MDLLCLLQSNDLSFPPAQRVNHMQGQCMTPNLPIERYLDPKFFEIPALREKHAAEKRSQEEAYQAARKAAEDDYQKQALQYDQIDLAPEVKESMKDILRENCRLKIRELDQKFKDEKAALEKRHNEEENKTWTAIIGLPSSVKVRFEFEFFSTKGPDAANTVAEWKCIKGCISKSVWEFWHAEVVASGVKGTADRASRLRI